MKSIVYEVEGKVILQTFVNEDEDIPFEHIVVDQLPTHPIETWKIENGELTVDPDLLQKEKNKHKKPLTRRQLKLALLDYDLLHKVEHAIDSITDEKERSRVSVEYQEALFFERANNTINKMVVMLGLTEEQVDELWEHAMTQ